MNVFEMKFYDEMERMEQEYKEKMEKQRAENKSKTIEVINKLYSQLKEKLDEQSLNDCTAILNQLEK